MAPKGGLLEFRPITPNFALILIASAPKDITIVHAVGHEQTVQLANKQLGQDAVKYARISVQLQSGDDLVLCQYIGPRLPEGATTLPEGAEIRWYYAIYLKHPTDDHTPFTT